MPKPLEVGEAPKDQGPRSNWQLRREQSSPNTPEDGLQAWLLAWELRQERLLLRHEEVMKQQLEQQLESLRRDLQCGRPSDTPNVIELPSPNSPTSRRRSAMTPSSNVDRNDLMSFMSSQSAWSASMPVQSNSVPVHRAEPCMSARRTFRKTQCERPTSRLRAAVYDAVHSTAFSVTTGALVLTYTLAMGAMAELEMRFAVEGKAEPAWLGGVDSSFAVVFFLELLLRLLGEGKSFFTGQERNWNIFDAVVALSGIADVGLGTQLKTGFLRILRACRVVRVLRVLRVFHSFSSMGYLQLMTESLVACLPCLGWGLVLLWSLQYVFAVILLRGAKEEVREGKLSPEARKVLEESFRGILEAMLALTQAISGGRSWGELLKLFAEVSAFYGLCFLLFIIFLIFGALNILTGIFVESTSGIARQNKELAVQEELARAENVKARIREFFQDLDADDSGTLSRDELALKDPKVRAYFSAVLQIDVADSLTLWQLLDQQKHGKVSLEEFVEECLRLRGQAKALDVAAVQRECDVMERQFRSFMKAFDERRKMENRRSMHEVL